MKPTYKVSVLLFLNDAPPKILKVKNCLSAEFAHNLAWAILEQAATDNRGRVAVNITEER